MTVSAFLEHKARGNRTRNTFTVGYAHNVRKRRVVDGLGVEHGRRKGEGK
jgi:hypothetical protein